ncbi:MAG: 16S rRNA (guanine(527)-N(7))-methyltransferase RsmG [Bacilli bacterium]|nr:16S rRNA (guanine(527)-N(7))-methyltransferase RsmG [Bacilli bacterium]
MNKEEFLKHLDELNISLAEKQVNQLETYANFLLSYNEHTNLTAIKKKDDVYLKHFYDSLTLVKYLNLNDYESLVDIGTGAGFPGVVLKIVYPHLKVTLIDSNNKKIKFLDELIKLLEVKNIETINVRSEDYARNNKDSYDIVTARAVTSLPVLSELCLPLVKIGGYFIPLKADATEEISLAKNIIKELNGEIESINEFSLPIENSKRTIIKIKKVDKTPDKYPRTYDKMKKALKKNIK